MSKLPVYEHLVQYYETDQMGVVHHSNYIRWFEEARIYIFDRIGLGYRELEKQGIIGPVTSVNAQFKTMTRFYDTVIVRVRFVRYTGVRLYVEYEVCDRDTGELRCIGQSEHCFIDRDGRIISVLKSYPEIHAKLLEYVEDKDD